MNMIENRVFDVSHGKVGDTEFLVVKDVTNGSPQVLAFPMSQVVSIEVGHEDPDIVSVLLSNGKAYVWDGYAGAIEKFTKLFD